MKNDYILIIDYIEKCLEEEKQFCPSQQKIECLLVFSSKLSIGQLRSIDVIENAALFLCEVLLQETFNIDNTFGDTDELRNA